jgi:hypothetical protein
VLNGRALSLTAVTLDANSITMPVPAPAGRAAMAPMAAGDLSAGVQETTAIQDTTATADSSTTAAPSTETAIETSPGTSTLQTPPEASTTQPTPPASSTPGTPPEEAVSVKESIEPDSAAEPGPTTGFIVTGEVTAP